MALDEHYVRSKSPVLTPDGSLYVIVGDTLFAVQTNSPGLADSPWPMPAGDAQRTGRARQGYSIFSSWIPIAAHLPGQHQSQWRTDVVLQNQGAIPAWVRFLLHTTHGDHEFSTTIAAGQQIQVEDLVGAMAIEDKGSLQILSGQALDGFARIYNQTGSGTQGQIMDLYLTADGLKEDENGWLLGLRQQDGLYRTNIALTNAGTEPAEVEITLFDADRTELHRYTISLEPTELLQDTEPFKFRAKKPNIGWATAQIRVISGSGILVSASLIDSQTNDPTTIPLKR